MINLEKIYKVYTMGDNDVYALNDVSLNIDEKEFVSIIGPSGSRKVYFNEYYRLFRCANQGNICY